jgi:A/G-specific adenine glycosylase
MYPVKEGKPKNRNRYFNYFDVRCGDYMYLHKRTGKDIWQGLYELPLIETGKDISIEEFQKEGNFRKLFPSGEVTIKYAAKMKHVLSHQTIYATFYMVEAAEISLSDEYLKINTGDSGDYPVSRLVHKYLETL